MANTVLILEDDPHTVEVVQLYLRRDGHSVLSATDGSAGLSLAREAGSCSNYPWARKLGESGIQDSWDREPKSEWACIHVRRVPRFLGNCLS